MCSPCAPGTSDEDTDASTACATCQAGFAADEGHTGACLSCAAGQFSLASAAACTDCPAGTTDDDSQPSTSCTTCLPGAYADARHAGLCDDCSAGRFNPVSGGKNVAACDVCQPGSFASAGSSSCAFCSGGTADEDSDPATPCSVCLSGTYSGCSETQCNDCVAGQVDSDNSAATPCTACLAGQYWVAQTGLSSSTCVQCEAGKYSPLGATVCTPCENGRYQHAKAQATCIACGAGKYGD